MTRRSGDDLLVRRASRGLVLQSAGLVAAAMLLLIALVTTLVVRGQQSAADELLRDTAATADDLGDPPSGSWIVFATPREVASSPGLPADLVPVLRRLRSMPTRPIRLETVDIRDGASFRVATQQQPGRVVQVALDLQPQLQDRERLFRAMGVAALLSLLVAIGLGVLLSRRAVRPLAQALRLQRTFVADASHELRTPLTLLSTRMQVLDRTLQRDFSDAQVQRDSRGVVADVQRLGEVVEDLLVAADPRRDTLDEIVDLAEVVAGVASSARAHAGAVGVEVTSSFEEAPCAVRGSATALRRAVLALVDNAIDHTPEGGQICVLVRRKGRDVLVRVSDTGPGIAPEAVAGLLQRFHSGGQRAGRAHYGLGLALTHDVADRHGGQLRVVPSASGATFELLLPAARVRPPAEH